MENNINEKTVSRKEYIINELSTVSPSQKEMAVFTSAKKMSEYIFVITEKSPKKYRWSIIGKMQNCSVEIIEDLYFANYEHDTTRLEYQEKAAVKLKLLDFYTLTAYEMQGITGHQTAVIAKHLAETTKYLVGWMKSTRSEINAKRIDKK